MRLFDHAHKWNFDLFIIIVVFIFLLGALLWFIKFTPVNSIKRFPIIVPSPESVCNFPCCDFSNHNERNQPRRVQSRGFSEANNLEANKSSQSVVNYNVCAAIKYQQQQRNKSKTRGQTWAHHTHVLYHLWRRLAGMKVPPRPGSALVDAIRLVGTTHRLTMPDRNRAARKIMAVWHHTV